MDGAVAQLPLPFSRAGKPALRAIDVDPMSLSAGELVGSDTLSTVAPVSETAMQFTWQTYQ